MTYFLPKVKFHPSTACPIMTKVVDEIIKVKFHPRLSHNGHAVVDGVLVGAGLLWPLEPAVLFVDGMGWVPIRCLYYIQGFPSFYNLQFERMNGSIEIGVGLKMKS
jgi:hypothetical protein